MTSKLPENNWIFQTPQEPKRYDIPWGWGSKDTHLSRDFNAITNPWTKAGIIIGTFFLSLFGGVPGVVFFRCVTFNTLKKQALETAATAAKTTAAAQESGVFQQLTPPSTTTRTVEEGTPPPGEGTGMASIPEDMTTIPVDLSSVSYEQQAPTSGTPPPSSSSTQQPTPKGAHAEGEAADLAAEQRPEISQEEAPEEREIVDRVSREYDRERPLLKKARSLTLKEAMEQALPVLQERSIVEQEKAAEGTSLSSQFLREKLEDYLTKKNLKLGTAIDNGDCLYDSIAQQLTRQGVKQASGEAHTPESVKQAMYDWYIKINPQDADKPFATKLNYTFSQKAIIKNAVDILKIQIDKESDSQRKEALERKYYPLKKVWNKISDLAWGTSHELAYLARVFKCQIDVELANPTDEGDNLMSHLKKKIEPQPEDYEIKTESFCEKGTKPQFTITIALYNNRHFMPVLEK